MSLMSLDVYLSEPVPPNPEFGPLRPLLPIFKALIDAGATGDMLEAAHAAVQGIEGYEKDVFDANITHNLGDMATVAGIYTALWHPEKCGVTTAGQLIEALTTGLSEMKAAPAKFKKLNASNGWGTYEDFVPWIEKYLQACKEHPAAKVRVSR